MRLRNLSLVVVFIMGAGPGVVAAGPSLPAGCALVLSGVTCVYSTSQLPLDFDQLVTDIDTFLGTLLPAQEVTGADGVVIEAWGGKGGSGNPGGTLDFCSSGDRGSQGYARTARLVSDVSAALTNGELYLYVGEKGSDRGSGGGYGGAASLVLQKALSDISSSDVTDPNGEGVYVIAGGGGGAGGCGAIFQSGGDGGDGNAAVAVLNTSLSAEGGWAPEACTGDFECQPRRNYGQGGNGDFNGTGGSQSASDSGAHGTDGIGGLGGAFSDSGSPAAWHGTSFDSWQYGRGGAGGLNLWGDSNQLSGHGGGGFGGGGGGTTYPNGGETNQGLGGGAGGSWARAASVDDSTLLVLGQGAGPGDQGQVALTFQTDDTFSADLGITKDDGVTSAVPGQDSIVYTIVASNGGPSDATNASVKDTFPSVLSCSWTSVAAGGATGNTSSSGDLDELLDMPADSSVTYTVTCSIDPTATGTLSNTATIHDTISDPGPDPNSATDDNTVLTPMADVSITKTDGLSSAVPGETTVVYTIVVSSAGPSEDTDVSVADTFPAALSCSWTSVLSSGVAAGHTSGSGPMLDDTLAMAPGSSVTYTVTCSIDPSATGTLSNTATATASVTDPGPGPNSATDNTSLTPEADLVFSKNAIDTLGDDPQLYDQFQYELEVTNQGPSTAVAVVVFDQLEPQLAFVDSDCDLIVNGDNPLIWNIASLAPGASAMCFLTVEIINFSHAIGNTAYAISQTEDLNRDNNQDSAQAVAGAIPVIPTLGVYGLLLLLAGIGGIGAWRLRRTR